MKSTGSQDEESDSRKLMNRHALAEALAVHADSVGRWAAQGCPVAKPGRGPRGALYRLGAVRAWLAARGTVALEEEAGETIDATAAKARKDLALARLAELKLKREQRELLPAAEVEKAWTAEVSAVRAKLLALPTTYVDRIHRAATLEGLPSVERLLREAVTGALTELSEGSHAAPGGDAA